MRGFFMKQNMKKLATLILTVIGCTFIFTACSFNFNFFKKDSHTHAYDNACDAICNECAETREVGEHAYDNACDVACNECEETRTVGEHDYSVLQTNETHHWYICSVCEREDGENKAAHTGGEATCNEQATCDVCETAYGELNAENHTGKGTHEYIGYQLVEYTYDCCDTVENHYESFIDYNCYCEECEEVAHLLNEACLCYDCNEFFHAINEMCYCINCSRYYHAEISSETGICAGCNQLGAAASIVIDGVKIYYATVDEAINTANGKTYTIVLENDCTVVEFETSITAGNIVFDLNGKKIDSISSNSSLTIDGGTVTIKDSVGGGETLETVFVFGGNLIIEGGKHSHLGPWDGVTITVYGGEIGSLSKTDTQDIQFYGGSFGNVQVLESIGTLADFLPDGYCFYDENGNEVDISKVEVDGSYYRLYNVTVGEKAE